MHVGEAERDKQHPTRDAAPGQGRPGWLPQMTFQFQIVSVATAPVASGKPQSTGNQSKLGEAGRPGVNVGKTNTVLLATLNFEAQVDLFPNTPWYRGD